MTVRLIAIIARAAQGPGSRPVRFTLAAFMVGQAVALMVSTWIPAENGPTWRVDVLVASAVNVVLALAFIGAPWHLLDDRAAALGAAGAFALGTSWAVFVSGGSAGLLSLALPVAACLAGVMFPWRQALAIGLAMVGSYLFGTQTHGALDFRSYYELAAGLIVTAVVLAGTIAMKCFLQSNAEVLTRQNAELDARVRELVAVSSLARSVGTTADGESLLRQGLRTALDATACDAGILFLTNEDGSLEPHHWVGLSDDVGAALCRAGSPPEHPPGVARWAAGGTGPVVVPDMKRWSFTGDAGNPAGVPAGVRGGLTAVPTAVEGMPFGALVVIDSRGLIPEERGMQVLQTVADELALAIDRQHHVDEQERQRRQLETFHGIARRVAASLEVQHILNFAVAQAAALVDADVAYIATMTGRDR